MKRFQSPVYQLSQIELGIPTEIQLLRVGTFHHPNYGKFTITKQHLKSMVKNFSENVRGIDIAIDFSHKNEEEAAGWVIAPILRNDDTELWSEIKWTDAGLKKVGGREFRYTSSEFSLNYQDNESLKEYGPTLLGVGLTNRPAVKGMEPIIQLSEYNNKKEPEVDKDEKIKSLEEEIKGLKAKLAEKDKDEDMGKKEDEIKELSEKNTSLEEENKKLKEEKRLSEKKEEFDKMLSEGKACEAQRKPFMEDNFSEFTKNAQPVKLSTEGHDGKEKKPKFESAQDEVLALAEKIVKEGKQEDLAEAVSVVLSENPELNKKYQEEVKF